MWIVSNSPLDIGDLLGLYNSRTSSSNMMGIVQRIWVEQYLGFSERVNYVNTHKRLPYKAHKVPYNNIPSGNRIICGNSGFEIIAVLTSGYEIQNEVIKFWYQMPASLNHKGYSVEKMQDFDLTVKNPDWGEEGTFDDTKLPCQH